MKTASKTAEHIRALAAEHGVSYAPAKRDAWAQDVTRLAGDSVVLDEIELLLVALQRAGHLTRPAALKLQAPICGKPSDDL